MTPTEWTALVVACLAALGTSGGIGSHIAARRASRAGISDRDAQARAEERRDRVEADRAAAERTERELARLVGLVEAQQEEINELRQWQREQFAREERQRTVLMHHAAWDWVVVQEVRRAGIRVEDPPPLTQPIPTQRSREDD